MKGRISSCVCFTLVNALLLALLFVGLNLKLKGNLRSSFLLFFKMKLRIIKRSLLLHTRRANQSMTQ